MQHLGRSSSVSLERHNTKPSHLLASAKEGHLHKEQKKQCDPHVVRLRSISTLGLSCLQRAVVGPELYLDLDPHQEGCGVGDEE